MFDLFLPYFIGLVVGVSPQTDAPQDVVVAPIIEDGSGDEDGLRDPEPQVPTGKFTTAVEVKPILGMTKSNWVAVRAYEGQDLLYFTHLMAWRCGLWDIRYGINGAPANTVVPMEPCYEDTAQPNGLVDVANFLPYTVHDLDTVTSVSLEIVYDDGTSDFASFDRAEILIP